MLNKFEVLFIDEAQDLIFITVGYGKKDLV